MKHTVYDRLLKREVGQQRRKYTDVRGIYGDRRWVDGLDIVNELEGHNGCVNTLSWSTSGRLLASGSDDHRINIHSYQPGSSTSQFSLATSILTGHRSNIFSVKFLPYSNDRTIVSATDDVRIFDIEYSGHSPFGSGSNRTRSSADRRSTGMARDVLTLTEGDTNSKAFRCHKETVKRIVTEDNPFYFLTCSNDGDVRQWDARKPSSAYLPLKDIMAPLWARDEDASDNVPSPLISYSRYALDLNTISCSPSQPHYIALGGAHLHCFLHDRRMLGRDKIRERGSKLASPVNWSDRDDELLGQATQCVKKFAPDGKQRMKRNDSGHITACKISDACPNELIVSWSQDHIYSFDMLRASDSREKVGRTKVIRAKPKYRVKDKNRKRKRTRSGPSSQDDTERASSRPRTQSSDSDLTLRVAYGNGQSEEIRIGSPNSTGMSREEVEELRATDHFRIAKTSVEIAKSVFDLGDYGETGLGLALTSILGLANSVLPDMDDIDRTWGYPVDPDPVDVAVQNNLRDKRAASRRFVQSSGTLARVLGGQLLSGANSDALISKYFSSIQASPRERNLPRHEQFGYDFLKAILLWIDSGPGAMIEGFSSHSSSSRQPIPRGADMGAIDDYLVPYLLELASDDPVIDVDRSKFEKDENIRLFSSEIEAVNAFALAVKIPFADLVEMPALEVALTEQPVQDRRSARRRWAYSIGRGVLRNAAKNITFAFVDCAYGGRGISDETLRNEDHIPKRQIQTIDPRFNEEAVPETGSGPSANIVASTSSSCLSSRSGLDRARIDTEEEDEDEDEENDEDTDGDLESDDDWNDDEEDEEDDTGEDGLRRTRSGRMLWRSDFSQSRFKREKVELDIPCAPHTRVYTGHCNVKTVKDVNFYGLRDEYVVSGSDDGNLFIWSRETAELVNILEGDGEVVNVVQGHPYEPTMAVSGIDHTIKIFSPDIHLQRNARKGISVQSADSYSLSSLQWGHPRQTQASLARNEHPTEDDSLSSSDDEVAARGLSSRKKMHDAYQITSKNDMERKSGRDDYFISQAVFAQLARHITARQDRDQAGDGEGQEQENGPIVITDDNCATM